MKRTRTGFSLVELAVLAGVLGLGLAVALGGASAATRQQRGTDERLTWARNACLALEALRADLARSRATRAEEVGIADGRLEVPVAAGGEGRAGARALLAGTAGAADGGAGARVAWELDPGGRLWRSETGAAARGRTALPGRYAAVTFALEGGCLTARLVPAVPAGAPVGGPGGERVELVERLAGISTARNAPGLVL